MLRNDSNSRITIDEFHWENIDDSTCPQDFAAYLQHMEAAQVGEALRGHIFELLPITDDSRVLDAGCGLGAHTRALAKKIGQRGSVVGIDKSKVMIESAKSYPVEEGCAELSFETGDICNLPYKNETFDAVFTDRVFIHLSRPEQALEEFRRVLRRGGHVVVAESDWSAMAISPDSSTARLLREEKVSRFKNPSFGAEMRAYLEQAGFNVLVREELSHELTEFDFIWRTMNLEGAGRSLIEKGIVSESNFAAFEDSMRRAEKEGSLSISGVMHFGLARKGRAL